MNVRCTAMLIMPQTNKSVCALAVLARENLPESLRIPIGVRRPPCTRKAPPRSPLAEVRRERIHALP
jgi:hypothetical protein